MRTPGKRVRRTGLVRTDKYVVAEGIELVIPVCLEAETVNLLRDQKHAEKDDLERLRRHGKVSAAVEAA